MTLHEFDAHFQELLRIPDLARVDASWNGVQIACSGKPVRRVACAVDASLESAERAAAWGADLLFVHHGFFWGEVLPVTGVHYNRLRSFLEHDLALYAAHLPLDVHETLGNNALIAASLGLEETRPFALYKGVAIGRMGRFPQPVALEEVAARFAGNRADLLGLLPFGPDPVASVGIVSGGAPRDVVQAIDAGLDLFITGDAAHSIYHNCLEARIGVMFGGHYRTETHGVRAISEYCTTTLGLESTFIDIPTGL